MEGGSSTPLYSGNYLANNTDLVVVCVNYRLGAFGFFYNGNQFPGNLGLLDQIAGLQWVQKNIANFGGDPNNVTIFGQSAGAMSIANLLLSPKATGLYHRAILESDPLTLSLNTQSSIQHLSTNFAVKLGCAITNVSCLQSTSMQNIITAQVASIQLIKSAPLQMAVPWQPYIDGKLLLAQPLPSFIAGKYNQVPIMIGNVESEGVMFVYSAFTSPLSVFDFDTMIDVIYGLSASKVKKMYPIPADSKNDTRPTLALLTTHYLFACPIRNASRYMAKNANLYRYHFDHVFSFDPWGPNYAFCAKKCCHGSELAYVFNSAPLAGYQWDSGETVLAKLVSSHWGNFATSGDPNKPVPVVTQWPIFSPQEDNVMHYMTPVSDVETDYLTDYCNFWDSIGYYFGTYSTAPQSHRRQSKNPNEDENSTPLSIGARRLLERFAKRVRV